MFSSFVYTPDTNFFGADSFSYQYRNDTGTELSNTVTVSLTVTAVNDAPVAADVVASTVEDTAITINLLAANAENARAELAFSIQTQPAHGSLALNADGSFTYTPAADCHGPDGFTYSVGDGDLTSNPATVNLTVISVDDAPTLPSHSLSLNEDASIDSTR